MGAPVDLEITGFAAGGRGVGRHDGRVWFVAGAVPGDHVRALPEKDGGRFVEAVAVERLKDAAERREAPCGYQDRCGGCPWMGLPEALHAEGKIQLVRDALERVGKLKKVPLEPLRQPVPPLGYRNRVEFSLLDDRWGLWGRDDGERTLIEVERCLLQSEAANRLLGALREVGVPPHSKGRLSIRTDDRERLWLGVWEGGTRWKGWSDRIDVLLERVPELVAIDRISTSASGRGGRRIESIHAGPRLHVDCGGDRLQLSATSFTQTSEEGAAALTAEVLAQVDPVADVTLWDLYAGHAGYSRALLRAGASRAYACEADATAINASKRMPRRGLHLVRSDVRRFLEQQRQRNVDWIVANPPRSGFDRGVAKAISASRATGLVLVSCDAPTMARDVAQLVRDGWQLEKIVPFDLFPQTAHVETVSRLRR